MLRIIRFHQDFTGKFAATRASGYLREQLEGSFGCPEIRPTQREIRRNHANQSHALKIVALCDHLRSDEHVQFTARERAEHLLVFALGANRVTIQPRDARRRKLFPQVFFYPFRSVAYEIHVLAIALRTFLRRTNCITAVVAFQALAALMIGQRDAAIFALDERAATAAKKRP